MRNSSASRHLDPPTIEIELYLVNREAVFPYTLAHPVHPVPIMFMVRPRDIQSVSNEAGIDHLLHHLA